MDVFRFIRFGVRGPIEFGFKILIADKSGQDDGGKKRDEDFPEPTLFGGRRCFRRIGFFGVIFVFSHGKSGASRFDGPGRPVV